MRRAAVVAALLAACAAPPPPARPTPSADAAVSDTCRRARELRARLPELEREGRIARIVARSKEADALCASPGVDPIVERARDELAHGGDPAELVALASAAKGDAARRLDDRALAALEREGARVVAVPAPVVRTGLRAAFAPDGKHVAIDSFFLDVERGIVTDLGATGGGGPRWIDARRALFWTGKAVEVWDVVRGVRSAKIDGDQGSYGSLTVHGATAAWLARADAKADIGAFLFDAAQDRLVRRIERHGRNARVVALDPAGTFAAASWDDGVVVNAVGEGPVEPTEPPIPGFLAEEPFSPDGKLLAIVRRSDVQLVDPRTKKVAFTLADKECTVTRAAMFSPDGKRFATANEGFICTFDLASRRVLTREPTSEMAHSHTALVWDGARPKAVWDASIEAPDPTRRSAIVCDEKTTFCRVEREGRVVFESGVPADSNGVRPVFSPNGGYLAVRDRGVFVVDLAAGASRHHDIPWLEGEVTRIDDTGAVRAVGVTGQRLLLYTARGDIGGAEELGAPAPATLSGDGRIVVVARAGEPFVRDTATGRTKPLPPTPGKEPKSVVASFDGRYGAVLYRAGDRGEVTVYDLRDGVALRSFPSTFAYLWAIGDDGAGVVGFGGDACTGAAPCVDAGSGPRPLRDGKDVAAGATIYRVQDGCLSQRTDASPPSFSVCKDGAAARTGRRVVVASWGVVSPHEDPKADVISVSHEGSAAALALRFASGEFAFAGDVALARRLLGCGVSRPGRAPQIFPLALCAERLERGGAR